MISLNDQWAKIQAIQNGSWRNTPILNIGQTVKQSLISNIQRSHYFRNKFPNYEPLSDDSINQMFQEVVLALTYNSPTTGKNFWEIPKAYVTTLANIFVGNIAQIKNNPFQQLLLLMQREILRINESFNTVLNPMIDHSDFPNDDIVRALCLSGTFCAARQGILVPSFSGMLIPAQRYDGASFGVSGLGVHTCLHVLEGVDPVTNYYFVPYGLPALSEFAFQVKRIHVSVSDAMNNKNAITQHTLAQMPRRSYSYPDYCCAVINVSSIAGYTLQQIFAYREMPNKNLLGPSPLFAGIDTTLAALPDLLGNNPANYNRFANFETKLGYQTYTVNNQTDHYLRYFSVIGRPDPTFQLNNSGFFISINLDNTYMDNPSMELEDDQDIMCPRNGIVSNRTAQSYPSIHGMSGGVILQTYRSTTVHQRLCRAMGTVHGGGRVFYNNQVIDLLASTNGIVQ